MRKLFQEPPSSGMNVNTDVLDDILAGVETIYVYPHHEINLSADNHFEQTRSGPNWEGGVVTMTTCKHLLRTYSTINAQGKVAICGVTNKLQGENYLMYIGVIDKAFDSNYDLYKYLEEYHPGVLAAKAVNHNRLGDVLVPEFDDLSGERYDLYGEERYDTFNFEEPCEDHCRREENDSKGFPKWIKDIEYSARNGTRPKCLILDPVTVHTLPVFAWTGKLGRSGVVFKGKDAVSEFLLNMEEVL